MRFLPATIIVSAAITVCAPVLACAEGLVPHRATYIVAGYLLEDLKGKPVLKGSAEIEYRRHCGAWHIESSLRYKGVVDGERRSLTLTSRMQESGGGRDFTFIRKVIKNGRKSVLRGTAKMKPRAGGEAFVEGPRGRVIVPLPENTLFPAAYYGRLLHALGREPEIRTKVFGFAQTGALLNVRAVMQAPDKAPKTKMTASLNSKKLWFVRFGYFDGAYDDQRRTHGARIMVNGNGVQLRFERERGWFLIKAWLTEATALVEKPCAKRNSASRTVR
jgi:hypothetical protein